MMSSTLPENKAFLRFRSGNGHTTRFVLPLAASLSPASAQVSPGGSAAVSVQPIWLQEQVKCDLVRFPLNFMFHLTDKGVEGMILHFAIPSKQVSCLEWKRTSFKVGGHFLVRWEQIDAEWLNTRIRLERENDA